MVNSQGLPFELRGAVASTRVWAPEHEVEPAALDQLRNISRLPWVHGVRAMPDVHLGKGATVGSVIAMRNAVSPSAVGVDIGCGMAGVRTSLTLEDLPDDLRALRLAFEDVVPVGFRGHDGEASVLRGRGPLGVRFDRLFARFDDLRADRIGERESRARSQCGTLGGGNHFIELCSDQEGRIWLTLHSGSRNIGKEIAERHIARAKALEWNSDLPDRDLAVFLHRDDDGRVLPEWDAYLHDLYWAQDYALLNRHAMLELLLAILRATFVGIAVDDPIQCHHNYVSEETHDGLDLVVTRKGAISAKQGELGIIPGSMGTGSFIVAGLGSAESFHSASHGAGRRMSRAAAKRTFTTDDLAEQTAGVECRKDAGVVDEIPGGYKDLNQVMANQEDLVSVVARLETLLCVKG